MVDAGEAKTRVAFYTGVMGSFTTIAGSLFGGAFLKKLVMYIKEIFYLNVMTYFNYHKVICNRVIWKCLWICNQQIYGLQCLLIVRFLQTVQ